MDFIEWASREYRLTKNKLVLHETILTLWNSWLTIIFLLLLGIAAGVAFGFAYADYRSVNGFEHFVDEPWATLGRFFGNMEHMIFSLGVSPLVSPVIVGIAFGSLSMLAPILLYLLFCAIWLVPFYNIVYLFLNKKFRSQINLLSPAQNRMLLTEYLSNRKIQIVDTGRKALVKPIAIYLTENFLFIPGFLLECRELVKDIHVQSSYNKNKKIHVSIFMLRTTKMRRIFCICCLFISAIKNRLK